MSAVVWQVAAATPASAAEHQSTLSAGYLHVHPQALLLAQH
ncbi:Ail/Lom family outer membrane beta-barrel protein, partial [Pseudomonas aeruginosa]